jgi:hypothetical protein
MKICLVGAKSFHAGRQTDRQAGRQAGRQTDRHVMKLTMEFHKFANLPKEPQNVVFR